MYFSLGYISRQPWSYLQQQLSTYATYTECVPGPLGIKYKFNNRGKRFVVERTPEYFVINISAIPVNRVVVTQNIRRSQRGFFARIYPQQGGIELKISPTLSNWLSMLVWLLLAVVIAIICPKGVVFLFLGILIIAACIYWINCRNRFREQVLSFIRSL